MTLTPASLGFFSGRGRGRCRPAGQMMITLTPWLISASTLAFSLAEVTLAEQNLDVVSSLRGLP